MDRATVYVVDDDEELRQAIAESIELSGTHKVLTFDRADPVIAAIRRDSYCAIVSDVRLPGTDGFEFLASVLEVDPALPVLLITGHGDVPLAVEAMRSGAYDFIEKPFSSGDLTNSVSRALERRRLVLENRALRNELADRSRLDARLVGRSPKMERLRAEAVAVADTDADVLIFGETGSGKEVVSRAIHQESRRRSGPFVALNCGALPAEMIESELFGHEQGAFTGAVRQRVGKLEDAHGGTVLLDEIESMPIGLQVKLLRVIETRTIERLGSNKQIKLDVRFLAATKVDLASASGEGKFREDLYYRLNVLSLRIPPLRERLEDVPLLFHYLARDARVRYGREIPDVPQTLMQRFLRHTWPGNVRELRNVADRWVLNVPLGSEFEPAADVGTELADNSLVKQTAQFEQDLIVRAIKEADGNVSAAAVALGLSRKTIYDRLHKFGLNPRQL